MPDKSNSKQPNTQALPPRTGEIIGGGYIIVCRDGGSSRIKMSRVPYEHGSEDDAWKQAKRLATLNPGRRYVVMREVGFFAT